MTAQTHRASRVDVETRRWMPSSRIRESLASSSPRTLRSVVPSFPRAFPPAGTPRERHTRAHDNKKHNLARTCYLTAPDPTAARFEVSPRVAGRTARSTRRSRRRGRLDLFIPGFLFTHRACKLRCKLRRGLPTVWVNGVYTSGCLVGLVCWLI